MQETTSPIDSIDPVHGENYPGILQRVKAIVIDYCVLLFVFVLAFNIINLIGSAPGYIRGGILIFMLFLYEPLTIALMGGTIGHYFMKLRVRNINDTSRNIILPLSFLRSFIKFTLGFISFFVISFDTQRRALHDMASGAIVIEVV